ncbi:DUF6883 domain-containing protein [Aneurinibacillus sp. XH2]|nr:DUF6883 domain-containing protein [Aneurinibacillus sp. XH2]
MFGSLKNIYDMYRLGKSVVNSKSFQKSLNRAEKEYQKRRKKQEEKLKRTKAGRRQLKEIKAYEKATKQLWKGFTQSFQTLGKVCTSARKLATNLLPIEQIYKLKKIMKAEVIKKQNSAIKKLQKPKPIQKPKSVSPSPPPKRSMMDDLVVGLKKFGREFKPAFSHGAKELATLSNYKPLTRELVGKENFDALTDNKWTMDDVKAAGGALENLFLGRLKIVKNINKTVKITKRLDKAKQPLQPPKPKQSTGNATKGMGKVQNALPNLENAKIDPRKLTDYALNPEHPVGGNKAKVFESALGYNKSNADELMKQVQEKLPQSEAILGKADQYGQRYTVDMQITGPNGNTTTVRTGWIIKPGSDVPEMTTIYVK